MGSFVSSIAAGVGLAAVVAGVGQLFALGHFYAATAAITGCCGFYYLVLTTPARLLARDRHASVYGRHFTPKHRFSLENNVLCAMPLVQLVQLLWTRRAYIDWQVYWFRLLFLVFMGSLQQALGFVEALVHGRGVEEAEVNERPVFVIGHPRTGTTHMQNLLALNSREFCHLTTFQIGFPLAYVWFEKYRWILGDSIVSSKRPMDDMALGWDTPQEDELATSVLTAGLSPYACISIMRGAEQFYDYFDFQKPAVAKVGARPFIHQLGCSSGAQA
jgi:hypothetical protein